MPKASKLDLYKEHKQDYVTPRKPVLLTIGPAKYLSIEGQGQPGGELFQTHLGSLYGVAFTIKMTSKFAGRDYKVMMLEGLWHHPDGQCAASGKPPKEWKWKLLIRTPDFITRKELHKAIAALKVKGKGPEVARVKLETFREGRCVQVLHVGPYDQEPQTIEVMKTFAEANGLSLKGPHHEVYLSDPRRVVPSKLRTILRQPVR
jgi:hypothetical protein